MLVPINGGKLPTRATKHSAAVDLYSNSEDLTIYPGETKIVKLGVCIDPDKLHYWGDDLKTVSKETMKPFKAAKLEDFMSTHYVALEPRSSIRAKGILSSTGIIDLDYKEEIAIILTNTSESHFRVLKGNRIAQCMLLQHSTSLFGIESTTERTSGFGSTGTR